MRNHYAALLFCSMLFFQSSFSQQVLLYPLNDSITSANNFVVCGTLEQKPLILKTIAGTPSELWRVNVTDMSIERSPLKVEVHGLNAESILSFGSHGRLGVFVVQQSVGSFIRRGFFTINNKGDLVTPFTLLDSTEMIGSESIDRKAFEVSFSPGKILLYRVNPETGTSIVSLDYYIIDSTTRKVNRQSHKLVTDLNFSNFSQPILHGPNVYFAVARARQNKTNRSSVRIYQFEEGQAKPRITDREMEADNLESLNFFLDSAHNTLRLFGIIRENNQPVGICQFSLFNGKLMEEEPETVMFPVDIIKSMKTSLKRKSAQQSPEEYLLQNASFTRGNELELVFERQQILLVDGDKAGVGLPQQSSSNTMVANFPSSNSAQFDQLRLNDAIKQQEMNNANYNSYGRTNVNQSLRNDVYQPPSASNIASSEGSSKVRLFRGHIFSVVVKGGKAELQATGEMKLSYDQLPIRSRYASDQSQKVMTYIPNHTNDWFILQSIQANRPVYSQLMMPPGVSLFYQDFVQIVNSCELLTIYTDEQNHLGLASIRW